MVTRLLAVVTWRAFHLPAVAPSSNTGQSFHGSETPGGTFLFPLFPFLLSTVLFVAQFHITIPIVHASKSLFGILNKIVALLELSFFVQVFPCSFAVFLLLSSAPLLTLLFLVAFVTE